MLLNTPNHISNIPIKIPIWSTMLSITSLKRSVKWNSSHFSNVFALRNLYISKELKISLLAQAEVWQRDCKRREARTVKFLTLDRSSWNFVYINVNRKLMRLHLLSFLFFTLNELVNQRKLRKTVVWGYWISFFSFLTIQPIMPFNLILLKKVSLIFNLPYFCFNVTSIFPLSK